MFLIVALCAWTTLSTRARSNETGQLFTPCLHESCLILLEDGTGGGLRTYDPRLEGMVTHHTARPIEPGYGLSHILGHQRPGSMAVMTQGLAFHGSGGLVVMLFLYDLLVTLFAALLLARARARWWLVVPLTFAFLVGARAIASYAVNENMLVLGLELGLLYLVTRDEDASESPLWTGAWLGAALALTAAVRPITALLGVGLLVLLRGRRARALFVITAALCALPWLLTNYQNYGQALYHPSLQVGQVSQSLFGWTFDFHPLNWPVADQLMRAADEPFPNLIRLPLELQQAFGFLFWIVVALGLTARSQSPRRLLAFGLMVLPNYLLLSTLVSLDSEKLSYALLSCMVLPTLAGAGARTLLDAEQTSLKRRFLAAGLAAGWLFLLPTWAAKQDLPVDDRAHYRTTGDRVDSNPAEMKTELLTRGWLPAMDAFVPDARATNLELLTYGGPPQQSPDTVVEGPLMLWLDHDDAPIEARIAPMTGSALPRLMRSRDTGCHAERGLVGASLYLHAMGDTVDLRALISRNVLQIAIDRGSGGEQSGYLSLGLHNDQMVDLEGVDIRLDGEALPVQLLVMDHKGERTLRVISNYPWHYEEVWWRSMPYPEPQATPGPWPAAPCYVHALPTGEAPPQGGQSRGEDRACLFHSVPNLDAPGIDAGCQSFPATPGPSR